MNINLDKSLQIKNTVIIILTYNLLNSCKYDLI